MSHTISLNGITWKEHDDVFTATRTVHDGLVLQIDNNGEEYMLTVDGIPQDRDNDLLALMHRAGTTFQP